MSGNAATMPRWGYRKRHGTVGYAWFGPFQIEWGDGLILRVGPRFYVAARFKVRYVR